jgi:hypothetical protein
MALQKTSIWKVVNSSRPWQPERISAPALPQRINDAC